MSPTATPTPVRQTRAQLMAELQAQTERMNAATAATERADAAARQLEADRAALPRDRAAQTQQAERPPVRIPPARLEEDNTRRRNDDTDDDPEEETRRVHRGGGMPSWLGTLLTGVGWVLAALVLALVCLWAYKTFVANNDGRTPVPALQVINENANPDPAAAPTNKFDALKAELKAEMKAADEKYQGANQKAKVATLTHMANAAENRANFMVKDGAAFLEDAYTKQTEIVTFAGTGVNLEQIPVVWWLNPLDRKTLLPAVKESADRIRNTGSNGLPRMVFDGVLAGDAPSAPFDLAGELPRDYVWYMLPDNLVPVGIKNTMRDSIKQTKALGEGHRKMVDAKLWGIRRLDGRDADAGLHMKPAPSRHHAGQESHEQSRFGAGAQAPQPQAAARPMIPPQQAGMVRQ